jgi:N-acetylmuramoyl-L-alanine amidase
LRLTFSSLRIALLATLLLALAAPFLRAQSTDKKLAVYTPQATYSVAIADRDNQEYIGLIDLLEPLGRVDARGDNKWKLEFTPANATQSVELEFQDGKRRAKIRGTNVDLPANFLLAGGRGYVPISALPDLLPRVLELTVQLHSPGRRLFIGNTALKLLAYLRKNPSRLVLTFPVAVSPFIASENGNMRLVFSRDPIVSPGSDVLTFSDPLIPSATFSEANGVAEFVVHGTSPLLATFGDNAHTITIAAAPQAATTPPTPPQPQATPDTSLQQQSPPPAGITSGLARRFLVVVDAAHGGEDRGASLTDTLAEKDVTLALARRIHHELELKGIPAILIRNGDSFLNFDQRAIATNINRAAAYISVHADTLGTGVRVYTALVPPAPPSNRRAFLPWNTAQASFLDTSSALAGSIAAECNTRKIPVRAMAAAILPLNSIATAGIVVELAPPPGATVDEITSEKYQQSIASAVATGVLAIRSKLEATR